ncbi:L,D-transpeptidase [Acinetobacter sp. 187]|uniref:cell wall-recycling L,D-carboxypeptidase ElsL n=1 Tax=Acinetobacter lanii TaxID=2715163 RepID=UPI001407BA0D|nr:cell wall-recycling L,D-carboxypeptidase ElsL [Acinetobacter lanii]NHC04611.1 L,D-transpeptidase [Acinetobacter lanii]
MYTIEHADILIDLESQTLALPKLNKFYLISSGLNGIGEQENSGKTPRGWHTVAQKIGHDLPINAVLKGRQWTGEVYDAELGASHPERDWILSRILWLRGLEAGFNQGEGCDTFNRYIYIHGTPDSEPMGIPKSHGCIRMNSQQVKEIFDLVEEGALVYISESKING